MHTYERKFYDTCYLIYMNKMKNLEVSSEVAMRESISAVKHEFLAEGIEISENEFRSWVTKIWSEIKIEMSDSVLSTGNKENQHDYKYSESSFFWKRYMIKLKEKNRDAKTIGEIDKITDEILNLIIPPATGEIFDRKGLVLGYVQSGKTANFIGVINKAFDRGYDLIIVLAGMSDALRKQTQERINYEVLNGNQGLEMDDINYVCALTSDVDDFRYRHMGRELDLNKKTICVVKKNPSVLRDLIKYIGNSDISNFNRNVLIIDDEADQASVNTAVATKGEGPKTVNKLIRQLLRLFDRKSYIGYTATPFANFLINTEEDHSEVGRDLFPKDFVISLPKPRGYYGPEEYFNDLAKERNPLRFIDYSESTELAKISDDEAVIPSGLSEAIRHFLIVAAIRELSEQRSNHNSMLIHVSQLTKGHKILLKVVNRYFKVLKTKILNTDTTMLELLKKEYDEIMFHSNKWKNKRVGICSWSKTLELIKKNIGKVELMMFNGESKDVLDYSNYSKVGKHVIVIGGNKISRGLTLEGLTISYYARPTKIMDTLMQMARWFGYRENYIDICRVYTTKELAEQFSDIANAMIEIREELEKMRKSGKKPSEFAIRMKTHPTMILTSKLKMQNAKLAIVNYEGRLVQTRNFGDGKKFYENNMNATKLLLGSLEKKRVISGVGKKLSYHLFSEVSVSRIKKFLEQYETINSYRADSKLMKKYIEYANSMNELRNWSVAVVEGYEGGYKVELPNVYIKNAIYRRKNEFDNYRGGHPDIKALVSGNNEEFLDMALKNIDLNDTARITNRRKRSGTEGLLLIYPLNPNVSTFEKVDVKFTSKLVPIGIAISFPFSEKNMDEKLYLYNKSIKTNVGVRL
ncbi:Z1 domain-containing protein [Listeria grandensis]|uniref:Z1 domain-containing protein n=1 Tax=Listeria grandensis TaxID=1494963 RepID=UPI00164D0C3E|nr:Z1 domain-containing protein [Listeria grandensis]MBC6316104.1 Z1 domain-containing protein [Listeria grandensis]